MFLGPLLTNAVAIRRDATTNDHGTRIRTFVEEATVASVQPMRSERVQLYGIEAGVTYHTVYFGADPRVRTNDQIAWGNTTLVCLTTASNQAGWGVVWSVDCKVINPPSR